MSYVFSRGPSYFQGGLLGLMSLRNFQGVSITTRWPSINAVEQATETLLISFLVKEIY
jgi:hypothetical protein